MSDLLDKPDTTESDTPMTTTLTRPTQLTLALPPALAQAGRAANAAAAARVFAQYRARLAEETRRRHDADLACFATYLAAANVISPGDTTGDIALGTTPARWAGVTWGLVAAFVEWQLQQGYAVGSVNVRLSTVKVYARLAAKAGSIPPEEYALIKLVAGFRFVEGRRVDAQRPQTRKEGAKKAAPVSISQAQADALKLQDDPRDRLLMCLLLDHGLRVGEVASLVAEDFDLERGVLRFYRQKVDKTQTHQLSDDTLAAAAAFFADYQNITTLFGVDRTIRRHVEALGAAVGLVGLSPHDCRHAWATFATRAGTQIKALQDAGGWNSPAMPLRYAESNEIANDGVKLR